MNHSECGTLFEASEALLRKSGLVSWSRQTFTFAPKHPSNDDSDFERYWKEEFHTEFGTYIAWVLFSVGAENLAKAACVCNGVVEKKTIPLKYRRYTDSIPVTEWVDGVIDGDSSHEDSATKHDYKPLERYWKCKLPRLCQKHPLCCSEERHLIASYKYLTQVIRNRDAHTYIPGQRLRDFPAVKPVFVPAFNTLIDTMRKNLHWD